MYRKFLLVLLLLSLVLLFLVVKPFLHTIILSVLLAALSTPLHRRLVRAYGGREGLAALTVVMLNVFIIVIPLLTMAFFILSKAFQTLNSIMAWIREGHLEQLMQDPRLAPYVDMARNWFDIRLESGGIQDQLIELSKTYSQSMLGMGALFLGSAFDTAVNFVIMVFMLFYFIRDGRTMVQAMRSLTPLRADQEERILEKIKAVTQSVVYGGFMTALSQGVAGGVGMAIAGIPPFFWGIVMAFASLLPVVGVGLVWVPMVAWLFMSGKVGMAIFMIAWSSIVVGTIDNFVRPFFMRGKAGMSPFYIFVAIIGGMAYFGMKGLLYGPLILSFAAIMLALYQREFSEVLAESEHGNITVLPDE